MAKTIKLNSGYEVPTLGYGTWQSKDAEALKVGLKAAIESGYRHIDTAHVYENEHIIGEALEELYQAGVVKREDLFITTKIFGSHFRPDLVVDHLKSQLAKLRTSYVDLYLMHFPVPMQTPEEGSKLPVKIGADGKIALDNETKIEDTWKKLEQCVELGLARSIGISNFNISQTKRFLENAKIKPAMNQVESHPIFQNTKLIKFCQEHGVAVTGYSCFGAPGTVSPLNGKAYIDVNILEDERILAIGKKHGKTAAHVILRWQILRGVVVIPKSVTPSRIADNFKVWDFELDDSDMAAMAAIDKNVRYSWLPIPGVKEHPEYPHITEDGSSC